MLLPPFEITKRAWQVYRDNWSVFLKVLIWLFVPTVLLGILAFFDERLGLAFADRSVPIYLGLSAFVFVVSLWAQIVLTRLVRHSLSQESVNMPSLREEAWRDTLPLLWVHSLCGLIVFLGTMLFIIPGIIFSIWYFFSSLAFILDSQHGMDALRASKKLVHGRFRIVVWRLVISYLPILAVLLVFTSALILLSGLLTGFSGISNGQYSWWFSLLQSIITYLLLPMSYGISVILFQDLKKNPQQ